MKSFFEKLFCKHTWKLWRKKVYTWDETTMVDGTEYWYNPKFKSLTYSNTTEVLHCEKCGKIKIIKY